jgi:hypothetical protein
MLSDVRTDDFVRCDVDGASSVSGGGMHAFVMMRPANAADSVVGMGGCRRHGRAFSADPSLKKYFCLYV